ncbi:MAG: bifunctional folylpolyglutamate synthase/dihydrofolate synthase [Clostridiales bacterium]|nr:bifunctional folylpolyglutamate synthase/dihydrofolate synthase [Clostridiales bacterium]
MPEDIPEFLTGALKFGIKPGLERITRLCGILGDPQESFKAVHIAGTNGKGSVSAFVSTMLACDDRTVGIFTSPYLERFSERIRIIDGRKGLEALEADEAYGEIAPDDLDRLSEEVRKATVQMTEEGYEHPTEFELITALCFLYFAEKKIDVAVLEVGLGGRLDSTNIISNPLVTSVCAIGYDHTDRLGTTIEEITGEKAGIFKNGCPAVCLDPSITILGDEDKVKVRSVLTAKAEEAGAKISFAGSKDVLDSCVFTEDGRMTFTYEGMTYTTSLNGKHQAGNAAVAIETARTAGISEDAISEGISRTIWKCRAEILCKDPVIVLDGGHNPQGAESLADLMGRIMGGRLCGKPVRLVMGVMVDKDLTNILTKYRDGGIEPVEAVAVRPDNPRSLPPDELLYNIKLVYNNGVKTKGFDDPCDGVRYALERSREDGIPILVTGSLYLLGQIRTYLKGII